MTLRQLFHQLKQTRRARKAQNGYGLALLIAFIASSVLVATSMQMLLGGVQGTLMQSRQDYDVALQVAQAGLVQAQTDLQTQLNQGASITTSYRYPSSGTNNISIPHDPTNLSGSTDVVGSYYATITATRGNTYLVNVIATADSASATCSQLFFMSPDQQQYLLDSVSGAIAAYSLRKLRSAYSGSAIRVRRSSDNTEQDIGFTASGDLDTTSLQSFVGYTTIAPPLDAGNAVVAYGLRKLRTAYAGAAINVRRSSDNTTQDIGFDSNGNLDTASLLNFVGTGSGYVTTWYDQTGNGHHATQATTTAQPTIVSSGALITIGSLGKPSLQFDGSSDGLTASASTAYPYGTAARTLSIVEQKAVTGSTWVFYGWGNYASSGYINASLLMSYSGSTAFADIITGEVASTTSGNDTSPHVATGMSSGTTGYIYVDGTLGASKSFPNYNTQSNSPLYIGKFTSASSGTTYYVNGKISEIIVYNSMLGTGSSSARSTLEANQKSYYISTSTGYVKTWYDQSGNGHDAIQTTTAMQPSITNAGSVVTMNGQGKPAILFTNAGSSNLVTASSSAWPSGAADRTINSVHQITSSATSSIIVMWGNRSSNGNASAILYDPHVGFWGNNSDVKASSGPTIGTVNRVTITDQSSAITVYSNGSSVATGTPTNNTVASTPLYIGTDSGNGLYPNALISEIIIYNSALNSTNRTAIDTSQSAYY